MAMVVALGFALQATAFGRPSPAKLQLVRTLTLLGAYDHSRATIELGGRRFATVCSEGRVQRSRVADVVVDHWAVIPELGNRLQRTGPLVEGQFELTGCPRVLKRWLSSELVRGATVELRPAMADGVRAYDVRLPSASLHLEVFIARSSGLPVELVLNGKRLRGTGDVTYGAAG